MTTKEIIAADRDKIAAMVVEHYRSVQEKRKQTSRVTGYSKCGCGALTVFLEDGDGYSVSEKLRDMFLPGLDLRKVKKYQKSYACDHCVNHYGLDLCACGSGLSPDECDGGLPECGKPTQVLGERTHVVAKDAWLMPERSVTIC